MNNTEKAFHWIVEILRKCDVPFQVTGGLAARVYGSERPLADIDIDIPEERFEDILPDVQEHITFGPDRFTDENWDLRLLRLNYEGQQIDICGDNMKIRSARTEKWEDCRTNFLASENHDVYGTLVPVITKEDLIDYKRVLDRPVDREDVAAILGRRGS
ncbi:MAG: hypothetical protein A3C90_01675 [Candidatus Magasanikbacteria bacterium RIFCSPHIGHO2_02_FULL_51_14]|uniref:MazG-related protein n=1 Tax=Candidatus Magasanikbacteria bacterium RIFCSPHIGHO2_02_FULL_51_14 TaxID=1798683 RepID=A0A1F6MPZ2_9BACT|nr:MAG: hypothetical protein A3C90_01675 [Candidatus Magasanikbacteria bacterium RIFCSPHIGHO2_02_FULL_51_14]